MRGVGVAGPTLSADPWSRDLAGGRRAAVSGPIRPWDPVGPGRRPWRRRAALHLFASHCAAPRFLPSRFRGFVALQQSRRWLK